MAQLKSAKSASSRPLSPHIQIYRWTLTMFLSILHRATGVALYAGTLLLAAWLVAVAQGAETYALAYECASSMWGQLILFGYVWVLFHHMFGGLRHFIWDMGKGFELSQVELLARGAAIIPLVITLFIFALVYDVI